MSFSFPLLAHLFCSDKTYLFNLMIDLTLCSYFYTYLREASECRVEDPNDTIRVRAESRKEGDYKIPVYESFDLDQRTNDGERQTA